MNLPESAKLLLAASGGDTVKLFDISVEPQNPCVLTHSPSPGLRVNSVRWNHNNLVLASAGEDGKISLWRKNGQSLWMVPAKNARGDTVESSESISTISFSNKGSRYLCSGGTGQVVRIWDLQNKRCVKWLKGHTDTITGAMYNCKDEHIASASRKGDIILHNLASGTKAAELRDPNGQVLCALDYSRMSRHLLVTAGDDGSVHMWDTTGRSPKASWLKQHSAPTSAVSFSPSNDKIIASVGLDMKLYTFDSGSKKPSSCIPYEAPFSSLAFTDDGLTLAAGTSTGQVVFYDVRGKPQPITVLRAYGNSEAVTNLCWQRSKPVTVNENNCSDDTVLLAGDVGDSVLMPDPLPSRTSSSLSMPSMVSGSRNPVRSGSGDLFSFPAGPASSALNLSASEETPLRSSLLTGGALTRLHAPRSYNFKDDMEVFSPLVEIQPITPSLDKLWGDHNGSKKDLDRKSSFLFPSRRFGLSEEGTNDNHPIFDWKSNSSSKQDDTTSTYTQLTPTPASARADDSSSITPPEAWGGERLSDKFTHHRHSINLPSRFSSLASTSSSSGLMSSGLQDNVPTSQSTSSLTSSLSLTSLRVRETLNHEGSLEAVSSPLGTKSIAAQANLDNLGPALSLPRRFSSYAERIGATPSLNETSSFPVGSPKSKKTGAETKEEILNSLLSRSEMPSASGSSALTAINGGMTHLPKAPLQSDSQQGNSFTHQLFQRSLEETLTSFQKSIHDDMRNLHLEILRQSHLQEMEMSNAMGLLFENQAEIMKELKSLRKETQQIRQLL
ncbi:Transducin/WD40 repeat-like superfamily protein [Perilla frutescens var. hirtella]|uniref:Transducin/WD40 repeat-like superfamily protein n=1 Tax=Perilla frutescens var. hirtella TaxID=608512 RepID=A0AAD4P533_PERFH|nr:Transducin/WD40 repeat-like superfamily protein [Perilla frutescens var. hirtella]